METIIIWLIIIAGFAGGGWFLWRTSRSTGPEGPEFGMPSWVKDTSSWRRFPGWAARNGGTARRNAGGLLSRLVAWWRSRGAEVPPLAAPAGRSAPAPAPRRPAPAALAARVLDEAVGPGAAGVLPPEWAALCARVSSFEPETDEHYHDHIRGEMAGFAAYSEAVRAGADVLASETGLDPAVVHAHLELADATGDCAHDVAMVGRRFSVVYAAVQEAVAAGVRLPFRAREFLTGAGG